MKFYNHVPWLEVCFHPLCWTSIGPFNLRTSCFQLWEYFLNYFFDDFYFPFSMFVLYEAPIIWIFYLLNLSFKFTTFWENSPMAFSNLLVFKISANVFLIPKISFNFLTLLLLFNDILSNIFRCLGNHGCLFLVHCEKQNHLYEVRNTRWDLLIVSLTVK